MEIEAKTPENSGKIQASGKYKKGCSGNPNGKPKGARNKSSLAAEALLEGSLEKICKKVEEEALNGNMQAAKMILERFLYRHQFCEHKFALNVFSLEQVAPFASSPRAA